MRRCLGCMREFGDAFDVCPHCGYIVGTGAASKNHLPPGDDSSCSVRPAL